MKADKINIDKIIKNSLSLEFEVYYPYRSKIRFLLLRVGLWFIKKSGITKNISVYHG
jgi:hypothetical protein